VETWIFFLRVSSNQNASSHFDKRLSMLMLCDYTESSLSLFISWICIKWYFLKSRKGIWMAKYGFWAHTIPKLWTLLWCHWNIWWPFFWSGPHFCHSLADDTQCYRALRKNTLKNLSITHFIVVQSIFHWDLVNADFLGGCFFRKSSAITKCMSFYFQVLIQ